MHYANGNANHIVIFTTTLHLTYIHSTSFLLWEVDKIMMQLDTYLLMMQIYEPSNAFQIRYCYTT